MAMQMKSSMLRQGVSARAAAAVPRVEVRPVALSSLAKSQRAGFTRVLGAGLRKASDRAQVTTNSTSASFDEGITGKDDYSPLIAVAGFLAVYFDKLHVDKQKLLQALAILSLVTTAINIVTQRGVGDGVSNTVAPTVLAAAVLNYRYINYLDAATFAFGYYISEHIGGIFNIPFYVPLATLAAAIYTGNGTLWYVAAFGVAAAGRLYKATSNKESIPIIPIPALAAAVWAIWKEAHYPLAIAIYLAQTVWSGFTALNLLTKKAQD